MRHVALMTLLLCLAARVRAQSITSFEPDTSARAARARAQADRVDRPVWLGFQVSPVSGAVTGLYSSNRDWDTDGTPWVGLNVAWPLASPHQGWFTAGYEHWSFTLHPEADPFGGLLLPYLSPVTMDQFVGRIGIDRLIRRDRAVSVAIGAGFGVGLGFVSVGLLPGTEKTASVEVIAHSLVLFKLGDAARAAIGASGGPTFQTYNSSGAWQHWELELRLDQALHRPAHHVPGP